MKAFCNSEICNKQKVKQLIMFHLLPSYKTVIVKGMVDLLHIKSVGDVIADMM